MDKDTIKKLTHLSKLSIPENDIDELSKNLDNILKLIGEIDAAPTDGMLPMAHPLDFSQPLRDDICKKDINREENQHDSTKIKDGYYTVPKILD
ncbi:Asp-tRNA(Asn)/Glu-tRNA(Gln) amidotransferase subunit GatC [Gammaproteobacteria bacterium]|jgi:aspartyl-tRNA(Asn)/glutamyl-tRNA(Gln) amidotransferase subunit C|nr:Asp-tRNA(Asn)/Glu-tRNA(Gln) amidotransferase subunit GatC [Gammaproteobacteria bacterium]|tara:strand:+ start:263 stop:544 length:282 start_codon:yes stop_codon:yes gene_type:complete